MLRRIRARSFGAFADLQSPEFGHVNIILGPNGAGKTSLKDLISLSLSGTATGFETGMGLMNLRTLDDDGAPGKRWKIDAQMVVAGAENTISRTDDDGPRSSKQQATEAITKCPGGKARACIEAGEFVRLDLKARQRLLADLAPKATVQLSPAIKKAVKDLLGEDRTDVEVSEIERLYKAAYDARTEAARDIKAIGDPEAPQTYDATLGPDDNPDEVLADVKTQLAELRTEKEAAIAKAAPKSIDVKPYQDAVTAKTSALEAVRMEIGRLPTKMEISRKAKELLDRITAVAETNAAIEAARLELKGKLGEAEGAMNQAKRALEALKEDGESSSCCPTCTKRLTKTERSKALFALQDKYDAEGRKWQTLKEQEKGATQQKSTADLYRETDQLSAKESRLATLLEQETKLSAELKEQQAKLDEAKAAPAVPGDSAAAGEAMELADRISQGEAMRDELVSHIAALKAYKATIDRKATAMQRHALLDQLVQDLGPTGIRAGAANAGMFAFHEDLNKLLEPRGFTVDLRPAMDAEGDPWVTVKGKKRPLGRLSDGERIAFGAAFACAVASVTGLGLVVIDKFEQLDPAAHDAVMQILAESPHQSFVLSVERDEGMEAIAADVNAENGALRMFLLRDGQLIAPGLAAKEGAAA